MMWTLLLLGQNAASPELNAASPELNAASPEPNARQLRLAVLPMEQGAGSQEYLGLGTGLSGMLLSDLSGVQGLTLVERSQIDAVLAELELAEGSFLDPETAVLVGKGVGAETLLVGSYSVVEQTFVLDARILQVSTGEVIVAKAVHGQVSDFVSVEKELVVGLVEGLELQLSAGNRRALYSSAPTESFWAFSAYGAGVAQEAAGDLEAAQRAYQEALRADPGFEQAQQALAGLKQAMVAYTQARSIQYDTAYRHMNEAVLLATKDLDPKAIRKEDLPAFVLRLAALENEGRDCQRVEEMRSYLISKDYRVAEPLRERALSMELNDRIEALQEKWAFVEYSDDAGGPPIAQQDTERGLWLFQTSEKFLLGTGSVGRVDFRGTAHREPNSGYLTSVQRCMAPQDALAELDRLVGELGSREILAPTDEGPSLGDQLEGLWLVWAAQLQGSSEVLATRSQRLLNRVRLVNPAKATPYEVELESWAIELIEEVLFEAELRDRATATLYGQSDAEGLAFLHALGAKDPARVDLLSPNCAHFEQASSSARSIWVDYQEEAVEEDYTWMLVGLTRGNVAYAPMKDLGCLIGEPARYSSLDQVLDLMRGVHAHNTGGESQSQECQDGLNELGRDLKTATQSREHWAPEMTGQMTVVWTRRYHMLRVDGCLSE
ncbi:MAG: tetratricopeptide (TPR) repeat protein [Cognaticolwellia sp.]|jgi:tetratricopeptide (TPR) repeat protein